MYDQTINKMAAYYRISRALFISFHPTISCFMSIAINDNKSLENATKFLDCAGITCRTMIKHNCDNGKGGIPPVRGIRKTLKPYIDKDNGLFAHISINKDNTLIQNGLLESGDFIIDIYFEYPTGNGMLYSMNLLMPSYHNMDLENQCELVGDSPAIKEMLDNSGFNDLVYPNHKFHTSLSLGWN